MHLTPNGIVSPIDQGYTSIVMHIKVCIKLIQNAQILACMLRTTPFKSVLALLC